MFHAVYPDGTPSVDFYNLTRAKDHTAVLLENELRKDIRRVGIGPTEPVGAFK